MVQQLEQIGANVTSITESVLNVASDPAKEVFKKAFSEADSGYRKINIHHSAPHAYDNVIVSKSKKAKNKNTFRLVGVLDADFKYMYMLEYGHSQAPAYPYLQKAYRETKEVVIPKMREAFISEFNKYMKG